MKRLFLLFLIGTFSVSSQMARGESEAPRDQLLDEQSTEREIRVRMDQEVRAAYAILLDQLGLSSDKEEALQRWLIQRSIEATWTQYRQGRELSEADRSKQIAEIIGSSKQAKFLSLERHISAYARASRLEALLEQHHLPIKKDQRDELVQLLVAVDDQFAANREALENSYEGTARIINRLNERDHRIVELLPSLLSAEQVKCVYDQYENQKQRRLDSLELQRKRRGEQAVDTDIPWGFPAD
jgi:hypothetical protein